MSESILKPGPRLDSAAASAFDQDVSSRLAGPSTRLLLDFTELSYISSAGLRVVLMAAKKVKADGGKLAICSLQPQIAEIFEISGFNSILPVHPDRESALASLR